MSSKQRQHVSTAKTLKRIMTVQVGSTTVESSMEISQKIKNGSAF